MSAKSEAKARFKEMIAKKNEKKGLDLKCQKCKKKGKDCKCGKGKK